VRTRGAAEYWHSKGGGVDRGREGEPLRRGGSRAATGRKIEAEHRGRQSQVKLRASAVETIEPTNRIGAEVLGQQMGLVRGF